MNVSAAGGKKGGLWATKSSYSMSEMIPTVPRNSKEVAMQLTCSEFLADTNQIKTSTCEIILALGID